MFESGRESWYNVCKQTLYHGASGFRVHREKSRRSNLPEGYRSRRVRYNVCKTDIIPWRIWLLPSCKIPDARIYRRMVMPKQYIKIRGANEHNLKNISVDIPRNELVVLTGLSGSGKILPWPLIRSTPRGRDGIWNPFRPMPASSWGRWRSPMWRASRGLSPAISIDQKSTNRNPRSTVGTVTEIYDYMRLFICQNRYPPLSQMRTGDQKADRGPDGGPDHGAAGAHTDPASGSHGAGKEGAA